MADLTKETIQQILAMAPPTVVASTLPGGIPSILVPMGFDVKALPTNSEYAERPLRKKGTVSVFDAASFVKYFGDFHDADSRIFADDSTSTVLAVLDYHQVGDAGPRWGQHRINLTLRKSEEWKTWTAQNGKQVDQKAFAEHIESNTPDIVEPSAATMLSLARSITAKSEIACESAIPTPNGTVTFRYNEMVKGQFGAAGEFSIPDEFKIAIPVYVGSAPVKLTARLRYRVASNKITLWYDLLRASAAERDAFAGIRDTIETETAVTILNGSPA